MIDQIITSIDSTLVCTMQWKHSFSPESSPKQCRQIFETQLVGSTSSYSLLSPCYRIRRHFLWRSAKILNTMFAEKIEDWSFTCLHGDDDVAPRCCRNHLVCGGFVLNCWTTYGSCHLCTVTVNERLCEERKRNISTYSLFCKHSRMIPGSTHNVSF